MAKDQQKENTSAAVNKVAIQEIEYTAEELSANSSKLFGVRPECVTAALRTAKKEKCTVSDAKDIVNRFMKKEVK